MLLFIGLGSACFHATSRYCMQLLDEIPMMLFLLLILNCLNGTSSPNTIMLNHVTYIISFGTTLFYIIKKDYQIFTTGFTGLVFITFYNCVIHKNANLRSNLSLVKSITSLTIGKICWELEVKWGCSKYKHAYLLHSLWHILSAFSASYILSTTYFLII